MKRFTLLAFLAAAAVLWASNNPPPAPEGGAVNRFQLASGPHPTKGHYPQGVPTLYRIDSSTGKVWALQSAPVRTEDGESIEFALWQEVQEPGGTWAQAAAQSLVPRK